MCFGNLSYPNGEWYVGGFRDNKYDGPGAYNYSNGDNYVGEFRNGKYHGHGTYTVPNGERYVGEWRENQRNGQGLHELANLDSYEGEYRNDQRHGRGTYTFRDRTRYVGDFQGNQRHGQGSFFSANGRLVQNGIWRDGRFVEPNNLPNPVLAAQGSPPRPPPQNPIPAAQRAPTRPPTQSTSGTRVRLIREAGTFKVPVRINGVLELQFTVDSGAADVTIPSDVVSTLVRTGTIGESDFVGEQTYILADGSRIRSRTFRIRQLQVGDRTITNVLGSVASVNGSLLLGQSFLSRFQRVSFDYGQGVLVLE